MGRNNVLVVAFAGCATGILLLRSRKTCDVIAVLSYPLQQYSNPDECSDLTSEAFWYRHFPESFIYVIYRHTAHYVDSLPHKLNFQVCCGKSPLSV